MSERLSFDVLRDGVVDAPAFQRACQRYAHGNGSSEAIAMAVLTAIDFGDLYLDALRYRWLRARDLDSIQQGGVFVGLTPENLVLNGADLDGAIDTEMDVLSQKDGA